MRRPFWQSVNTALASECLLAQTDPDALLDEVSKKQQINPPHHKFSEKLNVPCAVSLYLNQSISAE